MAPREETGTDEPTARLSDDAELATLIQGAREHALENVFDAVVVTDLEGRIVFWNPGSERLYGYTRAEVLGRSVDILHVPEDREHVLSEVLDHVERFGRWQGEIGMLHKDGHRGWIESSVVPLFDSDGVPVGALGINRDISGRIEEERARSRLFADIGHELRTPLTLTLGPLEDLLAGRHGAVPEQARTWIAEARRNALRVLDLTRQIVDLARLEAGSIELKARRFDLAALADQVAAPLAAVAASRSVRLDVRRPDQPLHVHGDPELLETLLSILLTHGLDATPAGGTVRLSATSDDGHARVAVRDSGPGIPAGSLSRVFDRLGEDGNPRTGSGGVRLALARELAGLHGGTVTAESEEGFGSTFTLTLPLGDAHLRPDQLVHDDGAAAVATAVGAGPATSEPESILEEAGFATVGSDAAVAEVDAPPAGDDPARADEDRDGDPDAAEDVPTVLVVEDDADIRAYLRQHLERTYRVLEAEDGDRGLERVREDLPDLVLADVMMPGLDGFELCRAIKSSSATDFIPVVLLTARAASEDRLEGLAQEADDYLTKPFRVRELLARVANLIASRKRLRERFAGPAIELHAEAVEVESADRRFLDTVRRAIEENLDDEDYSVERLAADVAHSRGHLHRRLRDLLDEAPSDLLRRMRLERAAQLIDAGAGSIGTIAYSVGFKSISHFSNRFQDHFGVRPSAYADRDT